MSPKQSNDATSSIVGTLYQLHIAVEKCFELLQGQTVYIEKFGDVSIAGDAQIETKHYVDPLTDGHPNLWKTLHNWVRDEFDPSQFSSLILLTTQQFGKEARISNWNHLNVNERLEMLVTIVADNETRFAKKADDPRSAPSAPSEVLKLQRRVMASGVREKLLVVISKFIIASASPDLSEMYSRLKDRFCKHILTAKCQTFLDSLLGFVASPPIALGEGWAISFAQFSEKVRELSELYSHQTRHFPVKHRALLQDGTRLPPVSVEPIFVQKIRDIDYADRIPTALQEHYAAKEMMHEEFKNYQVASATIEAFCAEVIEAFTPRYRIACMSLKDPAKDSKIFFDQTMAEPAPIFSGFASCPRSFRNGVLHIYFDEDVHRLQWKLVQV